MSDLRSVTQEICLNLGEQERVWRRMLELSLAQLHALQQQDVHSVHALLQEIEVAMVDRSRTELRRSMLLAQAAKLLSIPVEELTRDHLLPHADEAIAQEIVRAAEELRVLVVELDAVVARNAAMLEQELAIIDVLVRGATVDSSARTTYGKQGVQQEAPRLRLLDAQV